MVMKFGFIKGVPFLKGEAAVISQVTLCCMDLVLLDVRCCVTRVQICEVPFTSEYLVYISTLFTILNNKDTFMGIVLCDNVQCKQCDGPLYINLAPAG
jgi:hypothetical protein